MANKHCRCPGCNELILALPEDDIQCCPKCWENTSPAFRLKMVESQKLRQSVKSIADNIRKAYEIFAEKCESVEQASLRDRYGQRN